MEVNEIVSIVSNVGFQVAVCIALFFLYGKAKRKTSTRNRQVKRNSTEQCGSVNRTLYVD